MEKRKLSLSEMLQLAGKVNNWQWAENPGYLKRDWEQCMDYPKGNASLRGAEDG